MNEYVQAKVQTPGMALAAMGVLMLLLQCLGGVAAAVGGKSRSQEAVEVVGHGLLPLAGQKPAVARPPAASQSLRDRRGPEAACGHGG